MHLATIIPWFSVPPSDHHSLGADMIAQAWLQDADLGDTIAAMPWVVDGLSNEDFGLLLRLLDLVRSSNVPHTLLTTAFANTWPGDVKRHLVESFTVTALQSPEEFQQVISLPWVDDGLNEEEAAFLVALTNLAFAYPNGAYQQLLSGYFVQSSEVSLPLAGDIKVWVFQNTPFQPADTLAADIAAMVRIMEAFTMVPFPTADVILLLEVPPADHGYLVGGTNYLHSMWIPRYSDEVDHVPHETAHYYFYGDPNWLTEGASDFMESYVAYKQGVQTLDGWRDHLLAGSKWRSCASHSGIDSIVEFLYRYPNTLHASCSYALGEHFLLRVMEIVGEEALGAALGELHVQSTSRRSLSEEQIYDTLLRHTPPESREAFLEVYERLHGGPTLPNTPDDHGDDRGSATPLTVGQFVAGVLDYRSDLDFFSFQAEAGRQYSVTVQHGSLSPGSLAMYASDGSYIIASTARDVHRTVSGLEIRWEATSSGEYYISVENFAGESGSYTLTVARE